MTQQETNLIAIVQAWNPAVASQIIGCFDARTSVQKNLEIRHSELTTTLVPLLVEAKNQFEHRPLATLDRIDRCLKVLSQ